MSAKCCFTASTIDISLIVTPKARISVRALLYVRSVVPNPGMVIPMIPLRSSFSLSKALAATSSARVLSRPPDTPTTRLLQ